MKYEITFVLRSETVEKTALDKFTTFLNQEGYVVSEPLWWGKKTLSFPIKKQTEANYCSFIISADMKNPHILNKKLKQENDVLRTLILIKE